MLKHLHYTFEELPLFFFFKQTIALTIADSRSSWDTNWFHDGFARNHEHNITLLNLSAIQRQLDLLEFLENYLSFLSSDGLKATCKTCPYSTSIYHELDN